MPFQATMFALLCFQRAWLLLLSLYPHLKESAMLAQTIFIVASPERFRRSSGIGGYH